MSLSDKALRRIASKMTRVAELTHRRKTDQLSDYIMLFAEDEQRNEHYGPHVWTLHTELPSVDSDDKLIQFAMEYYGIDEDAARSSLNPDNIVDSAEAWDDPQFVSEVWEALEPVGYRTQDGALVLDKTSVDLDYHYDDPDDW